MSEWLLLLVGWVSGWLACWLHVACVGEECVYVGRWMLGCAYMCGTMKVDVLDDCGDILSG